MQTNRISLFRWCGWFFLGNCSLFWLVGLNYLKYIPWLDHPNLTAHAKWIIKFFAASAFIGHLGLLALLPILVLAPAILILPRRSFIFSISIVLATFLIILLAIDVITYQLYRFHLNPAILNLIFNQEVIGISHFEKLEITIFIIILFIIEIVYGLWLWRFFLKKDISKWLLKWCVFTIIFCFFLSYQFIIYSFGYFMSRLLIDDVRFLPLYSYMLGGLLPVKNGHQFIEKLNDQFLFQPEQINAPLNYQLPKTKQVLKKNYNLLIIVIDAWRFDLLNSQVTPHLSAFAKKSMVFSHHFSGGNSTGPGIFTLFYGIPFSYWSSVYSQHRSPLLIEELLKNHYQMGIFASATLKKPSFEKTVFVDVKNLPLETSGKTPYDRDRTITHEFQDFVKSAEKNPQPFFSFLFYDSAHTYCGFDEDLKPFQPAIEDCNRIELTNQSDPLPYFNRYKNALLLVDQQIQQVLNTLQDHHLLDKTIVIVTGDHGEEFNDNHLGFWGHASNFTAFQLQTPLIVHWPGVHPKTIQDVTSHYDIAPTVLKYLLGFQASPKEYSLGATLFDLQPRAYLVANSYVSLGIIQPNRIIEICPTGAYQIESFNNPWLSQSSSDSHDIQRALYDLRRFYVRTTYQALN